ncbi:MAG: hypothetical protein JW984_14615 [Deltaproteobacteria bacterium]|uniref:CUB domain-containing protein n=1 Tax=Candidatus Zymogenus saltonus TaxID=2844893 RepID=A0A9D8PR28_9DELT|nr:hypothetical protein [Candidatus Zymogenus saltonus]
MRLSKTIFIASLIFIAFSFSAKSASATVIIDYVDTTHSKWFTVHGPNKINFEFPFHTVNFWVNIKEPNGSVVDFDLNKGEIINLNAHGMHTITVYSKGGCGLFYAAYHTTETGYEYGSNRIPMCTTPRSGVRTNTGTAYGYLNSGKNCKWMVVDNTGEVRLDFAWAENSPVSTSPVIFRVRIENEKMQQLGDWELNRGTIPFLLQGGGTFFVTIYCTGGRGDWSCIFYPTGNKPPAEDHHHGGGSIIGTWATTNPVVVGATLCTWAFNADGTYFNSCKTLRETGVWYVVSHKGTYEVAGNTAIIHVKYRSHGGEPWVPSDHNYHFNFILEGNKLTESKYGTVFTRQ